MKKLSVWMVLVICAAITPPAPAGGTFVVCDDDRDPLTLDPQKQFSEKNHTILQQVYDGLVRFSPEGHIERALAVDWEQRDDHTMRFKLRRGVTFHNGEPFNADAVRFTIQRYLDPATGFPARGFIDSIDRVEVVDDYTVDIVTRYPDGLLLNRLAGFVLVVPPRYFQESDEKTLAERPVGTGAFRFDRWERGRAIHLTANPDYWNSGQPRLAGLEFRFAPLDRQVDLLLKGEVDVVTELPGTMTGAVQASGKAEVKKQQTFWTVAATMNIGRGPLGDPRVRRAMNLAIDRPEIVKYDARGNGAVIASLTMAGQHGHNSDLEPYAIDVAQANRLLDEAGVERPLVLRTLVRTQANRTSRILKTQLAKIGVELDIQAVVADAEVIARLQGEDWDVAIAGVPDPMCHSYFIQSILLYSKSPFSLMKGSAPEALEFDRRLESMASTLDLGEQERLGVELDRYVHEQNLSLFTYQKIKTYGLRTGVEFTPYISGMPYFFNAAAGPEAATPP